MVINHLRQIHQKPCELGLLVFLKSTHHRHRFFFRIDHRGRASTPRVPEKFFLSFLVLQLGGVNSSGRLRLVCRVQESLEVTNQINGLFCQGFQGPPMGLPYGMIWTHTIPISLGIRKWSLKIPLILVLVIGGLGTI